MAIGLEQALGDKLTAGLISSPDPPRTFEALARVLSADIRFRIETASKPRARHLRSWTGRTLSERS